MNGLRSYVAALRVTAPVGFVIGAAVGLLPWCGEWPRLSLLEGWRWGALGWLAGVGVAVPLGRLVSRRARTTGRGGAPGWRRSLGVGAATLALAPAALWLTLAVPDGVLRKGLLPGRAGRPDIILISIDALRADHVGSNGGIQGLTPNLDTFAREATRYDASYANSCWTITSMASVLTGLSPSECVVKPGTSDPTDEEAVGFMLMPKVPLLSERLGRAGYTTAAELTNHFLGRERGWNRGFDHFRNESSTDRFNADVTGAKNVTAHAVSWLRLNRRAPFFLWVHYLDPHSPYQSPDTPAELLARYPRGWEARCRTWFRKMVSEEKGTRLRYQEFCRAMYGEEVRHTDRWVGKLLEQIRESGRYDGALIVITADHGEELFDHGGLEHGHSMHEEVIRVPLLVKWPKGVEADSVVRQSVGLRKLHDTILEVAGVEGTRGEGLPRRDEGVGPEVFSEWNYYGAAQTALITDSYKSIYHLPEQGMAVQSRTHEPGPAQAERRKTAWFQVYDRRQDRTEQHDLAATKTASELCARLKQLTEAALAMRQRRSGEHASERVELSDKAKRDLRSLGYVGD